MRPFFHIGDESANKSGYNPCLILNDGFSTMALAIFDLDNTLLGGDSDYEWGQFLVDQKLVDQQEYENANKKFYEDYKNGILDVVEYSAFSFKPLTTRTMEELDELHAEFMQDVIRPIILEKAIALIQKHQEQGDTLIIITATNSFITRPIATELGIYNLLATDPKIENGRYTTEIEGTPCFKEGKVTRFNTWLKENEKNGLDIKDSAFYTDSINDLSLLELVDRPVAVDPDEKLRTTAEERNWEVISLR